MILKLSKDPKGVIRAAYQRCEREFSAGIETKTEVVSMNSVKPVNLLTGPVAKERTTRPTLYMPIVIKGRRQYALVDCGAELSVVSTAFANFAGLVEENFSNVYDASF